MTICNQYNHLPTPNYCQVPNVLLDEWISKLGNAEFKILMYMCRKTFGWHKIKDRISLSQMTKATGLTRSNIISAIRSLCKLGLLMKMKIGKVGQEQTYYEIIIHDNSNNSYQSYKKTPPSPVAGPTKETLTKEKEKEKEEKEKVLCGVKTPAPPPLLFFKKRVKMEMCSYKRLVNEFGESKIDEMIDRLDEYADINPRRFKQYAKHDVVIRKWIREDALKPKSKAVIEALELEKKEEQNRIFKEQQKAIEMLAANKKKQEQLIQEEKRNANMPVFKKYLEKFPKNLRLFLNDELYELTDIKYNKMSYLMCEENFENNIKKRLIDAGLLQ